MKAWLLDRNRRAALVVAASIAALHLVFAGRYGWFRDELYYVACAKRLAWGYVDHPPLVAVLTRLARALFGDSLVGLRSLSALAAAVTVVLAAEIARAFGGERRAQTIAAIATAIAPYDLVVGHIFTMNAVEPVIWGAIALVVTRALRDDDAKPLVWLGPIVGFGVLNKHSATWPILGLAIGIALSSSRKILVRRPTLVAAAVATLIVAPHVGWQIANAFPTREFARAALSGKNEPYGVLGFVGQQVQLLHPLAAPLWITGLASLLLSPALRRFRPLAVAYLLVATLIIVTQAKAYYLAPAGPWLFAAGAVTLERATAERPRARLISHVWTAVVIAVGVALLPVTIPVLSVPSFQAYAGALGAFGEQRSGEKMKPAALPQLYADMHGWPELANVVRDAVGRLSDDERSHALVLADNYGEASAIEHFGSDLPPVASGNNGWWLWGPVREAPAVLVVVGPIDMRLLGELYEEVEEVARFDHPLVRADQRDLPVRVCKKPRVPFVTGWARMKHYR